MHSLICNSLKLILHAVYRADCVRWTLCLSCIVLTVASSGCRKDSAQWKLAAAINEERSGNSEGAIELLQKALRMDPDSKPIKIRLALLLAENDQGDLGQMLCKEVLENDPQHGSAWLVLSQCLYRMGRFDESLAAYQKHVAHKIDKGPNELNQLAYFRALAGVQLDKALRQINEGIEKQETQFVPIGQQGFSLFAPQHPSWGTYTKVPIEINALVSAGLLSRYTDDGQKQVMGLLSDRIYEEQLTWLSANAQLDRLYKLQDSQSEDATKQEVEKRKQLVKMSAEFVDRVAPRNLPVLLATRSLMLDGQGQTELADLDRLWIKRVGKQPQDVYNSLPKDLECLSALSEVQEILDTRGFIQTQLPWQPTWTHPSGKVMEIEDRWPITYGSYDLALRDLDLAVVAAEVRLLALNSDAVNRIEYPLESIPGDKVGGAKLVAILRDHRRQAHLKAGQIEAAQRDQERIEELGWKKGDNLF